VLVPLARQGEALLPGPASTPANDPQSSAGQQEGFTALTRLFGGAFLVSSDYYASDLALASKVLAYPTRPRLILTSTVLTTSADQKTAGLKEAIDIRRDRLNVVAYPGQNVQAVPAYNVNFGLVDNFVESTTIPTPPASVTDAAGAAVTTPASALVILNTAVTQGVPIVAITPDTLTRLDELAISPEAKARITAAVQGGRVVFVPAESVLVNGSQTVGWYEIDPVTGETVGVTEDGGHEGFLEYIPTIVGIGIIGGILYVLISPVAMYQLRNALDLQNFGKPDKPVDFTQHSHNPAGDYLGGVGTTLINAATRGQPPDPFLDAVKEKLKGAGNNPDVHYHFEGKTHYPPHGVGKSQFLGAPQALAVSSDTTTRPDHSLDDLLFGAVSPQDLPTNSATASVPTAPVLPAGAVSGLGQVGSVQILGPLTASWSGQGTGGFEALTLDAGSATVRDVRGNLVGTGTVALRGASAVPVAISGPASLTVAGTGRLAFYGQAGSALLVNADWDNGTATVTGDLTVALTSDAITLGGQPLPPGSYTIGTSAAVLTSLARSTSSIASGSVAIGTTAGTVALGAGGSGVAVGGSPLDLSNGAALAGYSGGIHVSSGGANGVSVSFSGGTANVLTVSASPEALTADQNRTATFRANVKAGLADTYTVTAQAPPGWTVTVDAAGMVAVTTAPGLQGGTYPIQVAARSTTNPALVAQSIVNVTVAPSAPGLTLDVVPDPAFFVPSHGAEVPSAFQVKVRNDGPADETLSLTFSSPPAGFTFVKSGTVVTVPAGQTGVLGLYLVPSGQLPAPGTQAAFTVTATSAGGAVAVTQPVTFTVPVIDSVTLGGTPSTLETTPGSTATETVVVANEGNVPETVAMSADGSPDLLLGGLDPAPLSLAVGQSATVTLAVTAAASTLLNSSLQTTVTASARRARP
jgi:hypothetical protein